VELPSAAARAAGLPRRPGSHSQGAIRSTSSFQW
jgi:hypothetical protein